MRGDDFEIVAVQRDQLERFRTGHDTAFGMSGSNRKLGSRPARRKAGARITA
jgi:hypothetical protein